MGLVMDSDLVLAPSADTVPAPATVEAEAQSTLTLASVSPTVAPKLLEVHDGGAHGQGEGKEENQEEEQEEADDEDKNEKESGEADGSAFCLCQKPDTGAPMLMCDACSLWFHIGCVGISDIDHYEDNPHLKWFCPFCSGKQPRPTEGPLSKLPSRTPSPNSLADAELALAQAQAASSASSSTTTSKTAAKRARRNSTTTTKRTRTKASATAAKKRNSTAATATQEQMATSTQDNRASLPADGSQEREPAPPTSPTGTTETPPASTYRTRATRSSKGRASSTSDLPVQSPPMSPSTTATMSAATTRPTKRRASASESVTEAEPTASAPELTVQVPTPSGVTHSPTSASTPASPTSPSAASSSAPGIAVRRPSTAVQMGPPSRSSSTHSVTADSTPSASKRPAKTCNRPACDNRIDSAVYAPYCSQQCKTMVLAASHQRSASLPASSPATSSGSAAASGTAPEPVSPTTNPLVAYQRFKVAQDAVDAAERKTRDSMRKIIATALSSVLGNLPTPNELAALTEGGDLAPSEHEHDANMTRVFSSAEAQTLAAALEDAVYTLAAPPRESVTLTLPGADSPSTHAFRTMPLAGATDTAYRVAVRKLLTSLKSPKSDRLHAKLRRGLWTAHEAVAADPVEYSTETAREYQRARMQTLAQTVRESRDDEQVLVKKTHKGEVEVHRAAAGGLEDDRDIQMARAVAAAAARRKEMEDGDRRQSGLASPTAGRSPTGESADSLASLSDAHGSARSSAAELNMRRLSETSGVAAAVRRSSSMSALAAGPLVVAEEASARRAGDAVSKLPDVTDDVDAMMHGVSDQVVGQVVDLTGEDDMGKKSGGGEAGVAKLPVRADQVVDMLMDADGEEGEEESAEEQAEARSKPAPSKFTADSMLFDDDDDDDVNDGVSYEPSATASDPATSSLFRLFQGGQGDDGAAHSDTDDNHMQSIVFSSPVRSPTPDPIEAAATARAATWTGPLVEGGREPIGVQFVQVGGRKLSGATLRDQLSPAYFAPEMRIDGRLSLRRANEHLVNCHHSQTRELFGFEVQPDESRHPGSAALLDVLFDECHGFGKVAVLQRHDKGKPSHQVYLKDLYLYPLKPEDALPDWCRLFENQVSGIRTSNVVLAVLVGLTDQTPPSHPPASSMAPPPGLPQRNRDMSSSSSTWSPRDSGRDAYRIASPHTNSSGAAAAREPSAWSPRRGMHQDSPHNSSNGSRSLSGTPTTANVKTNTSTVAAPADPWDAWGGNATPRRDNPSAMSPANTAGALSTPPYTLAGNGTPLYNQQHQHGAAPTAPVAMPAQTTMGAQQFGMPAVATPNAQWSQHAATYGAVPAPAPVPFVHPQWTPQLIGALQAIPAMPVLDLTQPPTQMHYEVLAAYLRFQQQHGQVPQQYGSQQQGYQGYNPYEAANRRW